MYLCVWGFADVVVFGAFASHRPMRRQHELQPVAAQLLRIRWRHKSGKSCACGAGSGLAAVSSSVSCVQPEMYYFAAHPLSRFVSSHSKMVHSAGPPRFISCPDQCTAVGAVCCSGRPCHCRCGLEVVCLNEHVPLGRTHGGGYGDAGTWWSPARGSKLKCGVSERVTVSLKPQAWHVQSVRGSLASRCSSSRSRP